MLKCGTLRDGFTQSLAGEVEAVGVVDEAIQDGVGNGRIGDHVVPVLQVELAGNNGWAAAVAVVENLE